jgi:hypothetical protein
LLKLVGVSEDFVMEFHDCIRSCLLTAIFTVHSPIMFAMGLHRGVVVFVCITIDFKMDGLVVLYVVVLL